MHLCDSFLVLRKWMLVSLEILLLCNSHYSAIPVLHLHVLLWFYSEELGFGGFRGFEPFYRHFLRVCVFPWFNSDNEEVDDGELRNSIMVHSPILWYTFSMLNFSVLLWFNLAFEELSLKVYMWYKLHPSSIYSPLYIVMHFYSSRIIWRKWGF